MAYESAHFLEVLRSKPNLDIMVMLLMAGQISVKDQ